VSRPRSAESHAAILQAALELVVERGLQGTTIEGIAARAGVGKATIYRRWKTKEELFTEALRTVAFPLPDPDTGSLRGDIEAILAFNLEHATRQAALMMPRLMVEAADDPELFAVMQEVLVEARREVVRAILRRAVERGEMREDVDPEAAIDLLIGPFIYAVLATGADLPTVAERVQPVLDLALASLAPTPASRARARRRSAA
jgi:AcrR family transcriptional regulator